MSQHKISVHEFDLNGICYYEVIDISPSLIGVFAGRDVLTESDIDDIDNDDEFDVEYV